METIRAGVLELPTLVVNEARKPKMSLLPIVSTSKCLEQALLGLQAFQVAFLWVHDWLPLG